jgi:hypothetical protein
MAVEKWASVVDRESEYEVSSLGQVRSLPRFRSGRGGAPTKVAGRILRQGRSGKGYKKVSLGKGDSSLVHRLVARAFIANPGALPEVNHKDGDKANNSALNLEWTSHRENAAHASRSGLLAVGERHGRYTKKETF